MRNLGPGAVLGDYEIEQVVGRGGMGVVYRARQRRPARVVAIKVIAPELASDPAFRARFERESANAAEIEHPSVIPVYEVGEADGVLFLAMRFVEGVDLGGLLAKHGRLRPERAAHVISQVADALDAAHAHGLVHREVKPGNILVAAGDHVYLTDFGLTKRAADTSGMTRTGVVVGTVAYIAPEQIEGRRIDARTDEYALACVTHEALSGAVPFECESDVATLFAHVNEPAPRIQGVPAPLADAVQRGLSKRAQDRFPSAGDFGRAVLAGTTGRRFSGVERTVAVGEATIADLHAQMGRSAVTCPSCGGENPEGFRFCGFCTAPLEVATAGGSEERKVVTVLFCDVVGFTAADQPDPEEVRARIQPYHARVRAVIEPFGGTVEKFIGDALVAVFGVPSVHEDDPERAVRAGLEIVEAIGDLSEESDLDLQVRVGIETGEAVVALEDRVHRNEGIVTGDGVNTASRLHGVAPVNGVVVGPVTYAATKDVFDYEALEPVVLKGKAEPVPVWHARSPRARFGTDVTRRLDTALVGRQIELGILTGCFQRAVQERTVQLAMIVGEPGVGKSRLVAELGGFVDASPDLVRWRQGRCLPYGEGISFWALGEIVKAEAGVLETDASEVAGAKLERIVPGDHPDAPWLRARLRPLAGLEAPQAAREENFAAWRAVVELLAERRPSVLVFEDLHWADDALLAFLEQVADYAEGVPLLLVCTGRPELYERVPAWGASARNATRINLSPLAEAEMARLISNLLAQAVLPAEVQSAILERSGGNPLYAEEFVRLLIDRGILARTATPQRIEAGVEIPMPAGVQGLIAARLDTLSVERKRLLQDAAVIGKVFWVEAVAQMGGREPDEVARALHQLARKELVHPARRSSMAGQAEYAFHHALIRDVCYGQIPRAERADRHRRAVAWIEQTAGGRVEDHAAILASHVVSALELAGDGPDAQELRSKAIHYLTLAGDRSLGIDVEAAEDHYAKALRLAPENAAERPRILARHAEALHQRGRNADAARAFEQAIDGLRDQGDVAAMASAMARLTIPLHRLGDPRDRSTVDEALRLAEALGPSPELVAVLADAAGVYIIWDEDDRVVALADRAIALATELDLPEQARALGLRGSARAHLGDEHGVEDMRRALDVAISQGLGREAAVAYYNLADALGLSEGAAVRLKTLEEGLSFAQRRRIEGVALGCSAELVSALVELGCYDEAIERARELDQRLDAIGDIADLMIVRQSVVAALTRRGQLDGAVDVSRWTIERAREYKSPQHLVPALGRGAALHLAAGHLATAHALLKELEPIGRLTPQYAPILLDAVRTALALRDPGLARRLAEGLPSKPLLWEAALLTAGALIAEHEGRHAEAEHRLGEAAPRWQRLEVPWERAQALLGQGRCLIALGRSREASHQLRLAADLFGSLAATPALSETDALLERASAAAS